MKKNAIHIAIANTLIAVLFVVFFPTPSIQKERTIATVTQAEVLSQKVQYNYSRAQKKQYIETSEDIFPQLGAREFVVEKNFEQDEIIKSIVTCPIDATAIQFVIDFTKHGTVPLAELYVYANKGIQDAVHTEEDIFIEPGRYSVQLASYFVDENESSLIGGYTLEQRWYLEFLNHTGDNIYTTQSTRDIKSDEVSTIELIEHNILLTEPVFAVRAVHTAFRDTEEQPVAPLCVILTKSEITKDGTDGTESIVVPENDSTLFSAASLLHTATTPSTQHTTFTLSLMITLLSSIGVIVLFSLKPQE